MIARIFLGCLCIVLCHGLSYDNIMSTDETPTLGPEMDTVYVPGSPGGQWTEEEIDSTRARIIQMIHPDWNMKKYMGTSDNNLGRWKDGGGIVSENTILRLTFHDCIPYADGTGGCDGCLNWEHMYSPTPDPNNKASYYTYEPINTTDNKGLDNIVEKLELIYTTVDWPFQTPSLEVSLHQSGKSRADLWQLAGLIALESALERANRACDLDYHIRQQTRLLESREKCIIKLTKPLKFKTGRADCVSDDPEGRAYVTNKVENQPRLFGDANTIVDYGINAMNLTPEHWIALQGIHGAVHAARIGLKYTWFGPGYISNMYFKMIANHPKYSFDNGGDLAFATCLENNGKVSQQLDVQNFATGDKDGNPLPMTGWRASCMAMENTIEGGPCVLRPTGRMNHDNPSAGKITSNGCFQGVDDNGEVKIKQNCADKGCHINSDGVAVSCTLQTPYSDPEGPWSEDLSKKEKQARHAAWSNMFAFPWEVGFYYNFTVGGAGQRAIGCPGIDEDFGSLPNSKWRFRNNNSPLWHSGAMQCDVNTYAPTGRPLHEIVDEYASDNAVFAENFLEGWDHMTRNGYCDEDLVDGPQNAWMGHYSLTQQGIQINDFEEYIETNNPVDFTDPTADPWVCGHRGHATNSCGFRFSRFFELAKIQKSENVCQYWVGGKQAE